jgi:shikimate kinase
MNLILTGFMATGKSSVGKLVARRLSMRFVDMDEVIANTSGKSIARIFSEEGEEHFRQLETALARALAAQDGLVVATGGGCMLREANREALGASGLLVCLWASSEDIWRRASGDTSRPLLPKDGISGIQKLLTQRRDVYKLLPHHVSTTNLSIDEVAAKVIQLFKEVQAGRKVPHTREPVVASNV